jgi:hypothetical protein
MGGGVWSGQGRKGTTRRMSKSIWTHSWDWPTQRTRRSQVREVVQHQAIIYNSLYTCALFYYAM